MCNLHTLEVVRCPIQKIARDLNEGIIEIVGDEATVVDPDPRALADVERTLLSIPLHFRSDAAVKVLTDKHRWLSALINRGVQRFRPGEELRLAIKELEHGTNEQCPYAEHTLYKAWRMLQQHEGQWRALLPSFHMRGGRGGRRINEIVERCIAQALDQAESHKEKLQPTRVYLAATAKVQQWNRANPTAAALAPSLPTVTRRFRERFTAYQVAVRNFGKRRADRLFRENGTRRRAEMPLDIVEYDDVDTNTFTIDERTDLPCGRMWLTAGIDQATSCPMGTSLSPLPRDTQSAYAAVINGILLKDPNAPEFAQCKAEWEWYGYPGTIVLDNATYNHGKTLEASLLDLGCEVEFARPHVPSDKSDIEHFNARLKAEFIQHQPGYSGPKNDRDALKLGLATAVLPMAVFRRRLMKWIVDDYANKAIKGGATPRERWTRGFAAISPRMPARLPSFELERSLMILLRFRDSGGLERLGLRYQSSQLSKLRKRLGAKADVVARYVPDDLSKMFVLDPATQNYLLVPCIEDPRYTWGLTDFQQRLILKRARTLRKNSLGIVDMQEARDSLVKDTKELARSKKVTERTRSRRFGEIPSEVNNAGRGISQKEVVAKSGLELMIDSILEIEIEGDEDMEVYGHEKPLRGK